MKTGMRMGLVLLAGGWLALAAAQAAEWRTLTELTPGAKPQELTVDGPIHMLRIECLEGVVIINAVMIREGSARESFTVARRLDAGESHDVDLNGARTTSGLRIHDGGRGRYRVRVR